MSRINKLIIESLDHYIDRAIGPTADRLIDKSFELHDKLEKKPAFHRTKHAVHKAHKFIMRLHHKNKKINDWLDKEPSDPREW